MKSGKNKVSAAIENAADADEWDDLRDDELDTLTGKRGSARDALIEIGQRAELFHDLSGLSYAMVARGDVVECLEVSGPDFEDWLSLAYYKQTGRGAASSALKEAITTLKSKARIDGVQRDVSLRVAETGARAFLDLGDKDRTVIGITSKGWAVMPKPPVAFVRPKSARPLPLPLRSNNGIELLRKYVNVEQECFFQLVVFWMVAALRSTGPYPILILQGEQGSAKSTTAEFIAALIDPCLPLRRSLPRSEHDLAIAAEYSHVLSFDNVSDISNDMSDSLCRMATGGGLSTRTLYENRGQEVFSAVRPIIMNGIARFVTRPDLLNRSLIIPLRSIASERRTETELRREFEEDSPYILGALLDAAAVSLKRFPKIRVPHLPRMADFAKRSIAAETALFGKGAFVKAFRQAEGDQVALAIENDPIATSLIDFLDANGGQWAGTVSRLLAEIRQYAPSRHRSLPATHQLMGHYITRVTPLLRQVGIVVDRNAAHADKRIVTICRERRGRKGQ